MVPIAELAPADVRARPDDQARERRTEAQITGGELTLLIPAGAAEDAVVLHRARAERAAGTSTVARAERAAG